MNIVNIPNNPVNESLDELADLCNIWSKNREKGRTPHAIKSGIISACHSIILNQEFHRKLEEKMTENIHEKANTLPEESQGNSQDKILE